MMYTSEPILFDPSNTVVTIGIPVYNTQEAELRRNVKSVISFAKRYPGVEVIYHNDGSTEQHVAEILAESKKMLPAQVEIQTSDVNEGMKAARQSIINKAKGTYYFNFDSDDILAPFDAETEVSYLEDHTDIVATYTKRIIVDPKRETILSVSGLPSTAMYGLNSFVQSHNGAFFRMSALMSINGYMDLGNVEDDVGIFYRLCTHGKIQMRNALWGLICAHVDNCTERHAAVSVADRKELVASILDDMTQASSLYESDDEEFENALYAMTVGGKIFTNRINESQIVATLEEVLERNPDDYGCYVMLIDALLANNNGLKAAKVLKQALDVFDHQPNKLAGMLMLSTVSKTWLRQMAGSTFDKALNVYLTTPIGASDMLKKLLHEYSENQ